MVWHRDYIVAAIYKGVKEWIRNATLGQGIQVLVNHCATPVDVFLLNFFKIQYYSSLEVASEYFRSGADKISIGSDAVYAAEEYLKTGVKTGKTSLEQISYVYGNQVGNARLPILRSVHGEQIEKINSQPICYYIVTLDIMDSPIVDDCHQWRSQPSRLSVRSGFFKVAPKCACCTLFTTSLEILLLI
eukprot:Gb_32909 [translate_table: standard]